jgi:hypothetical protein
VVVERDSSDRLASSQPLRVGYGQEEITPSIGVCLAGNVSRRGRRCTSIRDPLFARALHLTTPTAEAYLVAVDLLVCTQALHRAVAERASVAPDTLLLSATHTHSAPGQYWDLGRGELFMGPYEGQIFEQLAERIATAIERSRAAPAPTRARAGAAEVVGASGNRRQRGGPVDPELRLLRFEPDAGAPISVVCFGAHPVVGGQLQPHTCSADYPGELCRRLEARGERAIFFTGAVGGLSPLFPEFPLSMDEHLTLLGDLLERGVERAERALRPVAADPLQASAIFVPRPRPSCAIFPSSGFASALAEAATTPLRRYVTRMGEDGWHPGDTRLGWVRLGDAAWLGTPCDLGVNVALALKRAMREAGIRHPFVGSQCDDYVGYVHLPADYQLAPEPGFRQMAWYENAMSLSGRDMGARFVAALGQHLASSREPPRSQRLESSTTIDGGAAP